MQSRSSLSIFGPPGVVAGLCLLGAGCASVEPGKGFPEVQSGVEKRIGLRVAWSPGTTNDPALDAEVRRLLVDPLTADSATQIALLNNRGLRAVYEDLTIAQADLVQAGMLSNPSINAGALISGGPGPYGLSFGIAQNFLELLYRPLKKDRAGVDFEAAKLRVTDAVLDLAGRTREAYFELSAAEECAVLSDKSAAAAQSAAESARRLKELGELSALETTQRWAAASEAKLDASQARARVAAGRERLNALLGVRSDTPWRLAPNPKGPPPEVPDAAVVEARAVDRSVPLEALAWQFEAAALTLGIERPRALLADLSVGFAAERDLGSSEWGFGPDVLIPLPIFDRGQARTARARAQLRAVVERRVALENQIRAEARAAWVAAAAASERWEETEHRLLPLRAQVLDETQKSYDAQQSRSFELVEAQRDFYQAQCRAVDARREAWVTRAGLELMMAGHRGGDGEADGAMTSDRSGDD